MAVRRVRDSATVPRHEPVRRGGGGTVEEQLHAEGAGA